MLWLWDCLVNPRPWPDPRSFIAAPTRDQCKIIYWKDIKALIPPAWIKSKSESDLSIVTRWNAELRLIGLDKPQRIEGPAWDGGCVDELADCRPGIWDANIRPAIADRQGSVDFLGVPDMHGPSQAEYEEMCGLAATNPEWADFCWGSDGILAASEIASMRSTMDPRLFEQETTGKFILKSGRALPDFDQHIHAGKPVPYDPALPLCWALDFNIDPMCSGVIQHHMGKVRVIDELVLPDTKTDSACDEFERRAKLNGWKLEGLCIYGDPTGSARDSTSGVSDWFIVRNRFPQARLKVHSSPQAIKDTLNALNAKIRAADGAVNLAIDPRCKTLIADCRSALSGTTMDEQHCLAWLRYFVHREYPIRTNRDTSGPVGTAQ